MRRLKRAAISLLVLSALTLFSCMSAAVRDRRIREIYEKHHVVVRAGGCFE